MIIEEWAAKPLLAKAGILTPASYVVNSADGARQAAEMLGRAVVVKGQTAAGRRDKAAVTKLANTPAAAEKHAQRILGTEVGGLRVLRLVVERQVPATHELYAAVIRDAASRKPVLHVSLKGGLELGELASRFPEALVRIPIDAAKGFEIATVDAALPRTLPCDRRRLLDALARLYETFAAYEADSVEINPLAVDKDGRLFAIDCRLVMDAGAISRHPELARKLGAETSA